MRNQTKVMNDLLNEYHQLKTELFGKDLFVIPESNSSRWDRYNQLFQFFYPQFRSKDFINPLN